MQSFEDVRAHLAARHELSDNEPWLMSFEYSVGEGRRQGLYLAELDDEAGRRYLRVSTPIAPIGDIDPRRCLAFNWAQRVGYLALSDLDEVPYLQLCENRTYAALDEVELDRLLDEIARLADGLERMIGYGRDLG
jgi:hypothetical protein